MKLLRYEWNDEIWLLHVEANNKSQNNKSIVYSRINGCSRNYGTEAGEEIIIKPGESYRFIISKKDTKETGIDIEFDEAILMKVFKLQDRAYLPTSSDMLYSNEVLQ